MAKVKRIVRKLAPAGRSFDEQLWPVYLALLVLGGYLIGIVLAKLSFFDPRIWANAIAWLVLIPTTIGGAMWALAVVDDTTVNRRSLLSLVLALIICFVALSGATQVIWFRYLDEVLANDDEPEERYRRVIPEYHEFQVNPEEQRRDFQRPVETEDVEEDPQDREREEQAEPEEATPKPQQVVAPEEQEVDPHSLEREQAEQTASRRNNPDSQLSRQNVSFQPRTAPPAATVKIEQSQNQPNNVNAQNPEVSRQQNDAQAQRQPKNVEPETPNELQQVATNRRTTPQREVNQDTSNPTLRRQVNQPKELPKTSTQAEAVATADAQQTDPSEIAPNTISTNKQQTTSPQTERTPTPPTPDTPTEIADNSTTRQQQTERMPQLARSEQPVVNRTTPSRMTPQPNVTAATAIASADTPSESQQTNLQATDAQVSRQSNNSPSPQAARQPTDTPETNTTEQIASANNTRAQSSQTESINPTAQPSNSPARTTAQNSINPSSQAEAVSVATYQPSESNSPQPAGVTVDRQSTTAPSQADAPTPNTPQPVAEVAQVSPSPQTRQQVTAPSPVAASTPRPVLNRTAATNSLPAANTVTAAEATPTQSPTASESDSPAPSSSQVARQPTQAQGDTSSPQPLETPSRSPSTELARAPTQRAVSAPSPTSNPTARPTNSPARAATNTEVAASPEAVAAPALAETRQTSNPSAEPSRLALNKAFNGAAGVGRSANLDRNLPADQRPAQVASGSAQRAKPTQATEPGAALSPSEPARISRSRAGAQAPSATLLAQATEAANRAGSRQPADIEASSSAAIAKANSNAEQGNVTADRGRLDIDRGPTQEISENSSQTDRASGGGQLAMNFETESREIVRANVGGSPRIALAEAEAAKVAQSPAGAGGGEPTPSEANPEATSVVRQESGGASPASGGPTQQASELTNESATAQLVAEAKVGRAETVDAAKAAPKLGGGSASPNRNSRGPKPAASPLTVASAEPTSNNPPMGAPDGTPAKPSNEQLARQSSGGAPTAGGPTKAENIGEPGQDAGESDSAQEVALAAGEVGRAEAVESTKGSPSAGGGTGSPTREAKGPAFAANTAAETVALAGEAGSSGKLDGNPIEARGGDLAKAAGVAGQPGGEAGAAQADEVVDAAATGDVGEIAGLERASTDASSNGPAPGDAQLVGGPGKRSAELNLPPGAAQQVALADIGGGSPEPGDRDDMIGGMDGGGVSRQQPGGLTVEVSAPEGPGGVGTEVALDTGTMNRRAQTDSQEVHFRPARFIRKKTGGPVSLNLLADTGTKAFRGRSKFKNKDFGSQGQRGELPLASEKAINLGLRFLSRHQSNDGSWSLGNFGAGRRGYERERTALHSDTAATGLCLLSFLGAGYDHNGDEYEEVVRAGIDYLVKNQRENGDLYIVQSGDELQAAVRLYSHGIAAIALCEAYGMTQDPELREPAQKALDFIEHAQDKQRGGWRYTPGKGSDMSVTGWMMMALKSGELAGLDVQPETLQRMDKWLDMAQASNAEPHLYVYNPLAPDTKEQRHGRDASKTMTSVGLLMRLYSGWRRDNPNMVRGARYLMEHLPENGSKEDPKRDTYYWYYATQVMYHMGGEFWEAWNERLHPLLTESQVQSGTMAGSWDPRGPVKDQWGPHAGRLYVTTLNILSLEVQHRHLPIYEDTAN